MTREEIKNKVIEIVTSKIGFFQNEISESTRFKADLGTDSLDDIELLMEFERVFGIKIPDEEMMGIVTVGDVINGLAARFGVVAEDRVKEEEWSEEDRKCLDWIIEHFRQSGGLYDNLIHWLTQLPKRFNPQPHWKPSEEQRKMLESLPDLLREFKLDISAQMLEVLREQLKKSYSL